MKEVQVNSSHSGQELSEKEKEKESHYDQPFPLPSQQVLSWPKPHEPVCKVRVPITLPCSSCPLTLAHPQGWTSISCYTQHGPSFVQE